MVTRLMYEGPEAGAHLCVSHLKSELFVYLLWASLKSNSLTRGCTAGASEQTQREHGEEWTVYCLCLLSVLTFSCLKH